MPFMFEHREYGRLLLDVMFDINSEETKDPHEAITFVAQLPNGNWLAGLCSEGKIVDARLE